MSVTAGTPFVNVPVLSKAIAFRAPASSKWMPPLIKTPFLAAFPIAVTTATDAIAEQGGDPSKVNPVVPTQLIVDHSLAVEAPGFDPDAFEKNREIEDRRNEDRFHFIDWTKTAFERQC